jgi:hypothetical protein
VLLPPEGGPVGAPGSDRAFVGVRTDETVEVRLAALRSVALDFVLPKEAPDDYRLAVTRADGAVAVRWSVDHLHTRTKPLSLSLTRAPHVVELVSEDRQWAARADVAAGAETVHATISRRPLHAVRVRFVDAAGAPVVGTRVVVRVPEAPFLQPAEFRTDASGEVPLELPDGRYTVVHRLPDGPESVSQPFDVPADDPVIVRM